ncbi:hypothetical protein K8T06_02265 [bacterium]|nr:hypothetical protein [bacterium]
MNIKKLNPNQPVPGLSQQTIGGFWSWAYSDILSNRNRAIFAEYIVGTLLGVTDHPRIEWDAVDFRYGEITIEVKSAAYLQSWIQKKPSKIVFDIAKKRGWDSATNSNSEDPVRSADCYVFCLYTELDAMTANVTDVTKWKFYVLSREKIETEFGDQKSVSLSRLEQYCDPINNHDLRSSIDEVIKELL